MTFSADPIGLRPRLLPRRWGREAVPAWCESAPRPPAPIGEIWIAHAHNMTSDGVHFGALLAEAPQSMLGELGRAPPTLRLITTAEPSDAILAEGALGLWRILEAPLDGQVNIYGGDRAPPRAMRCRRGDLVRVGAGARLVFPASVTALEARANFTPTNTPGAARAQKLLAASEKRHRAAWLRDPAMSVELWTLPKLSFLEPDGETCHVLMTKQDVGDQHQELAHRKVMAIVFADFHERGQTITEETAITRPDQAAAIFHDRALFALCMFAPAAARPALMVRDGGDDLTDEVGDRRSTEISQLQAKPCFACLARDHEVFHGPREAGAITLRVRGLKLFE